MAAVEPFTLSKGAVFALFTTSQDLEIGQPIIDYVSEYISLHKGKTGSDPFI